MELVWEQDTWKHNTDSNNTVHSNSAYDMECGYDAGDGQYFKDSSSDRLVLIWGWSDRDYINNQCGYDYV